MCDKKPEIDEKTAIADAGKLRTIRFVANQSGRFLAREFLDSLENKDRKKVRSLFRRMAEYGEDGVRNEEVFKHEEGEIWAFKRGQVRLPCFRIENCWYLTHGFKKKCDKWPKAELERAENIRLDCINTLRKRT